MENPGRFLVSGIKNRKKNNNNMNNIKNYNSKNICRKTTTKQLSLVVTQLKLILFNIQMADASKELIEFHQKSIDAIRCILTMTTITDT